MLGLTPSHGRPELVRALMEGLAFWLRDNIALFYSLGIAPLKPEIAVIGGATQAAPLLQIKADITGCPIKVPQITEAAATGAALLAGIGANIFHSGEEAASSVLHTDQIYEPDAQAVEKYNTTYEQTYLPARRLFM
jgi:sugar (pentulose or hexulose) kinase